MSQNKLVDISIIFIALIFLFVVLHQFQTFLRPFVIALILSFLFVPFTRLPSHKKKTIWLTTTAITASLFLVIVFLSVLFVDESVNEEPEEEVQTSLEELLNLEPIKVGDSEFDLNSVADPKEIAQSVGSFIRNIVSSLGSFFSEALLSLLFLFFILPTHDATVNKISSGLDHNSKKKFIKALEQIEKSIRDYLAIKSMVSLLTALLSAVIMVLFGVKFVVFFAVMIFLLNFIPTIGSILAVLVVVVIHFLTSDFSGLVILFAILMILVQIIVGNIIEPQLAGKKLNLSPVVILLSLFFWSAIWGIGGMFFAVPLTSIIKIVLQNNDSTKGFVPFLN